ncbi:udp-glucose:glycoprotein glucosyltransferase [Stylonychia lemnae]|uniref:Udp-glucose:glycoprotein glucosyltransferase n=1 Tax=Stylonychia lemnae TaxID=5949 RepID=A0A078A8C5_STYLE|nr:udp-glucose:glycoprotein glucosyltransferase [Stylonychia lemnae]|eukprot:CDW78121.1 udp-glucose:glycoprotein glucosyltransferase [Stylonychia lemnae]
MSQSFCQEILQSNLRKEILLDDIDEEFSESDKLRLFDLGISDLYLIYLDLTTINEFKQQHKSFKSKNLILRWKFSDKSVKENYEQINGIGIEFKIKTPERLTNTLDIHTVQYDDKLFTDRIIKDKDIYYKFKNAIINQIKESESLQQVTNVIQNTPSLNFFEQSAILRYKPSNLKGQITKKEFMIVNHRYIELGLTNTEARNLDKELQQIERDSNILQSFFIDEEQYRLFNQRVLEYLYNRRRTIFVPYLNGRFEDHYISLNDMNFDERTEIQESTIFPHFMSQQDYRDTLRIKSNAINIILHLDINNNREQQKLISTLIQMNKNLISFQLSVQFSYTNISNSLTSKDNIRNLYYNDMEILTQNSISSCENTNICVFPTMIINGVVIDQSQLLLVLTHQSESYIYKYLKEVIQNNAENTVNLFKDGYIDQDSDFRTVYFEFNKNLIRTQVFNKDTNNYRQGEIFRSNIVMDYEDIFENKDNQRNIEFEVIFRLKEQNGYSVSKLAQSQSLIKKEFYLDNKSNKTQNSYPLQIQVKAHLMQKYYVRVLSVLNQFKQDNIDMKLYIFDSERQLGLENNLIRFHYYRLYYDTNQIDCIKKSSKIMNIDTEFRYILFDIDQIQGLNFIAKNISHYFSYIKDDIRNISISHKVFGFNSSLELDNGRWKKYDHKLKLDFQLKEISQVVQLFQKQSDIGVQENNFATKNAFIIRDHRGVKQITHNMLNYLYIRVQNPGRLCLSLANQLILEVRKISWQSYQPIFSNKRYKGQNSFKFYFIENQYMSPDFRQNLNALSEKLSFDYELLNYQWPEVILQRDFQPGRNFIFYRVLFLDQLFPQDVDRVIFMDADQAIKDFTNIKELFEVDLMDKPYGFVSHCRLLQTYFISQYWKQLLQERGLDYHFGGLFIADISKFRYNIYGDLLRSAYQRLQKDELNENLGLLDQDLVNYIQNQVQIHTIHKKWLWCEAWCDKEDEEFAMVIDFCTDPFRLQENKFKRAVRLIDGYLDLFETVKQQINE